MSTLAQRAAERRQAVALARHYRQAEGLSNAQIAARLGRSPATIKGYFYDPTGEKARAVKSRYQGVCRGCGALPPRVAARATRTTIASAAIQARSAIGWMFGRAVGAKLDSPIDLLLWTVSARSDERIGLRL
jgi:hypothetical protein